MQINYLKVEILSPVHIGSGTTVDALSYVVESTATGGICHFVDAAAWAAEHPDPDELLGIFSSDSIANMRAYMAEHLDPKSYSERSCRIENPEIVTTYQKKKIDPHNKLELSPNLIGGSGGPLLPGSSIKGAIRTAIIDWLDREHRLHLKSGRNIRDQGDKLKPFFGDITNNSFQQLKIADCEAALDSSLIVAAREIRRNPEKNVTPKANCEIFSSRLLGDSQAATLACKLVLGAARGGQSTDTLCLKNGQQLNWEQLADLVNAYSQSRYQAEKQNFWTLSHFAASKAALENIEPLIMQPPPGSMVLKVGHYSQIEYVTVADNKPLTRKAKNGGYLPHGTTRTLADGVYPFGWIMLSPCSEQDYQSIMNDIARRTTTQADSRKQRRARHHAAYQQRIKDRMEKIAAQKAAAAERERMQQEEAAQPWLAHIRQAQQLCDWGGLKQFMENGEVASYRSNKDLAQALLDAAVRVRNQKPEKWTAERGEQVNSWLSASELVLGGNDLENQTPENVAEDVARISQLREFGDYLNLDPDLSTLSREALSALKEKMRDWGCHTRKAKRNKQDAYKAIEKALARR